MKRKKMTPAQKRRLAVSEVVRVWGWPQEPVAFADRLLTILDGMP